MTQTTGGLSFLAARVLVSADGSSWVNVSGEAASVAVSGGDRATGEQNTMDGDMPIVKAGKRASIDLTVRGVYTETAAEFFETLRAIYETAGGACWIQYAPAGDDEFWFHSADGADALTSGILTSPGYPGGDVSSGDVIMSEFVVKVAQLVKATASVTD